MARSAPKRVVQWICVATSCGRALVLEAAHAGVEPLGVLAHDDEVDVLRPLVLERAVHAGVELDRPQVDVLVQLEPHGEQDALLQDARRHVGVADGAQVDGVELAQLVQGARPAGSRRCGGSARPRSRKLTVSYLNPTALAAASRTFSPSRTTSGPVPSPGITAILYTLFSLPNTGVVTGDVTLPQSPASLWRDDRGLVYTHAN